MSSLVSIKSGQLSVLRLALQPGSAAEQVEALRDKLDAAPGYFEGEALVLDASACGEAPDWKALAQLLKAAGLVVLGVHGPEALQQSAQNACGWPALTLSNPAGRRSAADSDPAPASAPELTITAPSGQTEGPTVALAKTDSTSSKVTAAGPQAVSGPVAAAPQSAAIPAGPIWRPTMVIERPLRSGQRIYAPQADLLVHGIVSHGAEVIADGHIHVYGPLRGRVMAGAQGDTTAQIYCTQLDAELIGIAGIYRTTDTPLPEHLRNKAVRIRLFNQSLVIEALDSGHTTTSNSTQGRPA